MVGGVCLLLCREEKGSVWRRSVRREEGARMGRKVG